MMLSFRPSDPPAAPDATAVVRDGRHALAGPLEAGGPGAGPDDGRARVVGDGDDRMVEGRLDVGHPETDLLAGFLLLGAGFRRHGRSPSLRFLLFELLDPLALAPLPAPGVGLGPLAPDGQLLLVPEAPVAADVDQPLDVHGDLLAEVALDLLPLLDDLADLVDLVLGPGLGPLVSVS